MDAVAVQSWQKQPEEKAVVWQHNRLADARYELTAREQKLRLYVIAMIEPDDEDFKRYIINIGGRVWDQQIATERVLSDARVDAWDAAARAQQRAVLQLYR